MDCPAPAEAMLSPGVSARPLTALIVDDEPLAQRRLRHRRVLPLEKVARPLHEPVGRLLQEVEHVHMRELLVVEAGEFPDVEADQCLSIVLTLLQHGDPGKAGLGALEDEQLEEGAVLVERHAPLGVVIGEVESVARPWARGGGRR